MNPPFSQGARHILHAWEIAPPGCTIVALCNDNSISDSWYDRNSTKARLTETIRMYGRSEGLGDVFSRGERRTDVQVALVKLYKEGSGEDEFEGYIFSQFDDDTGDGSEGLMRYNFVRDLVGRYIQAVKLFDGVMQAAREINETADFFDYETVTEDGETGTRKRTYGYLPIRFTTVTADNKGAVITRQQYKKELQKFYWGIIFKKLNMEKYATSHLREQINRFVESQKQVPFTMSNIYKVVSIVVQTNGQRMLNALSEAFDLICSYSAENSTAGEKWKTNANYMVNRRFIVPYITEGYFYGSTRPTVDFPCGGGRTERMEDVCKALCYLTGRNYDEIGSLTQVGRGQQWGQWFEWGFFRCRGYKKGTMHFEFLDEDVWYRFNCEVARHKKWALPKKPKKNK